MTLIAQLVTPLGFHAFGHAHQQVAAAFGLRHFEAQAVGGFALARNRLQVYTGGAFENGVGDGRRIGGPVELVIGRVLRLFGERQQPGLHHASELPLMHWHGSRHMQHVLGLTQLVGHNAGVHG